MSHRLVSMEVTADIATLYLRENAELLNALEIDAADAHALLAVPLKQGEHNANFTFAHPSTGQKLVLRVNYISQLGLDDQIGYECQALKFLEPSGCTPRARYVDGSKQLDGHGALVMDFHEGRYPVFKSADDMSRVAAMLANVHAVPVGADCPLVRPGDPLRAQYDECAGYFATYRASALADPAACTAIEHMMAMTEQALDAPFDSADACHVQNTEAVSDHFLLSERGHGDCMVDWEKPIVGEVAQDVAYFLSPTTTIWTSGEKHIFSTREREFFVNAYWKAVNGRFDRGRFEQRFDAYVKTNCMRGITWSANAWVEYHDPARPLKSPETFELLKMYLSPEFREQCYDICFG